MAHREKRKSFINITEVPVEDDFVPIHKLTKKNTARAAIQTDDWWLWELAGILISAAALTGIVSFLLYLNNKPQPDWAYTSPVRTVAGKTIPAVTIAISPNSVLSLLSTIARTCVLIPITKGLAQMKWVWFAEKERDLSDFEVFENATRGITGSLFLVWKLKFRHFAVLGAIAVLLGVAFDPFVQNLLGYYSRNVEDPNLPAQMTRASQFTGSDVIYGGGGLKDLDAPMKSAIIAGFSHSSSYDTPKYYCATGNCTWTGTTSLGICSRCADVTSYLTTVCHKTNVTFPTVPMTDRCHFSLRNGFALDSLPEPDRTVSANVSVGESPIVFGNYSTPIAVIHAIFGSWENTDGYRQGVWSGTDMFATECVLVPCVQVYNASVGSPLPNSGSSVSVSFRDKVTAEYDKYTLVGTDTPLNNSIPTNETSNRGYWLRPKDDVFGHETYRMYLGATQQIRNYLQQTLPGVVQILASSDTRVNFVNAAYAKALPDVSSSLFLQQLFTSYSKFMCDPTMHPGIGLNDGYSLPVQCAVENMARAMTAYIRNSLQDHSYQFTASIDSTLGDHYKPEQINVGITLVSKTFIGVKWVWLALPLALWLMAVVMLLGTIWKTRMAGIRTWRTSTLATLFLHLGIGQEERDKIELHDMTAPGLERKAETLRVRLHVTERDAKLVPT